MEELLLLAFGDSAASATATASVKFNQREAYLGYILVSPPSRIQCWRQTCARARAHISWRFLACVITAKEVEMFEVEHFRVHEFNHFLTTPQMQIYLCLNSLNVVKKWCDLRVLFSSCFCSTYAPIITRSRNFFTRIRKLTLKNHFSL